jgi:hypothetical protein
MLELSFIIAPLLLATYYVVLITSKRRSTRRPPLVVQYQAPSNLSPAAARYVWRGCVDQRTVACVFAGLATKGRLTMHLENGAYRIGKVAVPPSTPPLNVEEQSTMEWLFSNFLDKATFRPTQDVNGCIMSLRALLDRQLCNQYRTGRSGWAVLGMAASLLVSLLLAVRTVSDTSAGIKFAATLFLLTFMTGVLAGALLIPAVVDLARGLGNVSRLLASFAITAFAAAGAVAVWLQLGRFAPAALGIMICVLVLMNVIAVPLLRVVTPKGLQAQAQIEGFREYLLKVEQDPLDRMIHPESAPPPQATMLSYAIALEVKEAWGDDLVNACFPG